MKDPIAALTITVERGFSRLNANETLTRKAVLSLRDRVASIERHLYGEDGARTARRRKRRK